MLLILSRILDKRYILSLYMGTVPFVVFQHRFSTKDSFLHVNSGTQYKVWLGVRYIIQSPVYATFTHTDICFHIDLKG